MSLRLNNWLVPGASETIQHPLYRLDTRRSRKTATLETFPQRIRRPLLIIFTLIVGGWGFYVLSALIMRPDQHINPFSNSIIIILFLISLPANFLLDMGAVLVAIRSINQQRRHGNWDLIELTDISPRDVVAVKHRIAQCHGVRLLGMFAGLRWGIVAIGLLHLMTLTDHWIYTQSTTGLIRSRSATFFEYHLDRLIEQPLEIFTYAAVALIIFTYMVEVFWRYRALTAFGVLISARTRSTSLSIVAGGVGIIFIWISQGFLLYLWFQVIESFNRNSYPYAMSLYAGFFVIALTSFFIYAYYAVLRTEALNTASRHTFQKQRN